VHHVGLLEPGFFPFINAFCIKQRVNGVSVNGSTR
jgi:hypothetical protein